MAEAGLPVLFALFLWWFSTGVIFWLSGRPAHTRHSVHIGATAVLAAALAGLVGLRGETSLAGAYLSFLCGIAVWGWLEIGFLFGTLTGPRTSPCPPQAAGFRRFRLALGTILWHELAILGAGTLMIWATWGHPNQIGTWTFVLLMGMRVSAKLNLFLGVPYPPTDLLPAHLAHMGSYFRTAPLNPLLPAVITVSTALLALVIWRATDPGLDAFHVTGYTLFGTMLALGLIEHWFLVLPVRDSALWTWFLTDKRRGKASLSCSRSKDMTVRSTNVPASPAAAGGQKRESALTASIQGG